MDPNPDIRFQPNQLIFCAVHTDVSAELPGRWAIVQFINLTRSPGCPGAVGISVFPSMTYATVAAISSSSPSKFHVFCISWGEKAVKYDESVAMTLNSLVRIQCM